MADKSSVEQDRQRS